MIVTMEPLVESAKIAVNYNSIEKVKVDKVTVSIARAVGAGACH